MAVSSSYVARETFGNLRRNFFMTLAAVLAMAVSLSLLGFSLVGRQAVNKETIQWRGGVQMAIFLQPTVTDQETAAIGHELQSTPGIKTFHFVNKNQAFTEFKEIFGGNNDITSVLTASDMPPSYRVVPTRLQDVDELGKQFQGQPGVLQVSIAAQQIHELLKSSNQKKWGAGVLAVAMMVAAIALIVITIQMAIFSRRREVAVMKLVGATNWFIRVPFMLEGLIAGVGGAGVAFALVYGFREWIASFFANSGPLLNLGQHVYISPWEAIVTGIVLLVIGVGVGAMGSAFAVRRFLSV